MKRLLPERELFWEKVDLFHGITDEDCWNFTAALDKDGYGRFTIRDDNGIKKKVYAHRYCWEIFKPSIPKGICVLHKCDYPPCVNPIHLFLGTHKDNVSDMDNKGRRRFGVVTKLAESQVEEIRATEDYRGVVNDLSQKHNVSTSVISEIRSGKAWPTSNPERFVRRMAVIPEPK